MDGQAVADERLRAGSRALSVFGHALTGKVLRAHAGGPLRFGGLEETFPGTPQTSLRFALKEMREVGALVQPPPADGERAAPNQLTAPGEELLEVGEVLERWLQRSPIGPISLTATNGLNAIRALVDGWNTTLVRELAEQPLTHTELSARISDQSHYALGRRLAKLRSTRLVTQPRTRGRGKPFEVSDWLRHAIAPLCIAARWERTHLGAAASPIDRMEVEAAFLLTLPLIALGRRMSGSCVLAVMTSPGDGDERKSEVAGVNVFVDAGEVVSCTSADSFSPTTWALGSPDAWLAAVVEGRLYRLRTRGENGRLPIHIVQEIHERLFPA